MDKKPTKRKRNSAGGYGRTMQAFSFSLNPQTVENLKIKLAESTMTLSAFAEMAINRALADTELMKRINQDFSKW